MQKSPSVPAVLADRYELQDHLGTGGFAHVYRAYDKLLDRAVAIKFMRQDRMNQPGILVRFQREARAVARLSHPGIMSVHDLGQQDGWHYLVLEYIPGQTLLELCRAQGGVLPLTTALTIIRNLLIAVDYAHQNGIVHRDLKPENVKITSDNQIKVMDFGLALREDDVRITEAGAVVGTVLYMAPEVAQGNDSDHRADLYATGAIFYELLTGDPPYTGSSAVEILSKVMSKPVQRPQILNPEIPASVDAFVMRLLAKEPADRFPDAASALEALPTQPDRLVDDVLQTRISQRLSRPRLERLVQSSSQIDAAGDDVQAEDESGRMTQQLLVFAAQEDTLDALEAERHRIAGLLQSEVISQLNLIMAQANAYEQAMRGNVPISVLSALIRGLLQRARDLESGLRPTVLETLGLEAALEALVSQTMRTQGVSITLQTQRMQGRLSPAIEMLLYRTAQDALARAADGVRQIQIMLLWEPDGVHLHLSDDGDRPASDTLKRISQRIMAMGGEIDITSGHRGGLVLDVRFAVDTPVDLTEREMDVIRLVAEGLTNKEIAAMLGISPRTAKFHLDNIFNKLGVNSRTEAAIYALRHGWVRRS